jgi:hypothetical protein
MRSVWFSTVLFLMVSSFVISSCKDKNEDNDTLPVPAKAGKGGTTTLQVVPIHDTVNVDSGMVYIKYDTEIVPTTTASYDDSAFVVFYNNKNEAVFSSLKKGHYVLYSKAWDKVRSVTVSGSRTYEITTDFTTYQLDLQLH